MILQGIRKRGGNIFKQRNCAAEINLSRQDTDDRDFRKIYNISYNIIVTATGVIGTFNRKFIDGAV